MKFLSVALFSFFLSMSAMATPEKIEMIFLSPQKTALLQDYLNRHDTTRALALLSQSEQSYKDNCIPMGEGCFHPQFGYLNQKPVLVGGGLKTETKETTEVTPLDIDKAAPELQLKTFNATETNLVNCEAGNYFDIFCGKEKEVTRSSDVEIWFDTSSSLRAADYNKDPNFCNRRSFLTKVQEACKAKVSASVFNTAIKQVGESSSVCLSYGGNDEKKLFSWIKDSKAKYLLIITDLDEMSKEMRDFLESHGAKFLGELKPFSSSDLVDYAKEVAGNCK